MNRTRLLPLAATAAAALVLPAGATAATEVEYRADLDVTATWSLSRFEDRGGHDTSKLDASAKARVKASIDHVVFRDGHLLTTDRWGLAEVTAQGSGTGVETRWNATKETVDTTTGACTAAAAPVAAGQTTLKADPGFSGPGVGVFLHVADWVSVQLDCDKTPSSAFAFTGGGEPGFGAFDSWIRFPPESIGMGQVTHNLEAPANFQSPHYCPGQDYRTVSCSFTWTGTITFTRTDGWTSVDVPGGDQGGGQPGGNGGPTGPSTPTTPTQPTTPVTRGLPLLAKRATLARRATRLSLTATCPAGCTGTAVLRRGAQRLGTVRFRVGAGTASTVKVPLPAKLRRAVRRAGSVTAHVTLTPTGGGTPVRRALALRVPR